MVKVEYANAYKEVLDILKYVSKEDLNKIPTKKIEMFSKYANYDYVKVYNGNDKFIGWIRLYFR